MNLWLVVGAGAAKIALLLIWSKGWEHESCSRSHGALFSGRKWHTNSKIKRGNTHCSLYIHHLLFQVNSVLQVIFPRPVNGASQQVTFNRQMLFGGNAFPGRNTHDQFSLRLDDLRNIAAGSLLLVNMVPMQ